MGAFYSFAFISMKLDPNQSFDINILKGAYLTNPNGTEFKVKGISVDLANHQISLDLIQLGDTGDELFAALSSLEWSTLKDWSIQVQNSY
jgi:hypothetical protein